MEAQHPPYVSIRGHRPRRDPIFSWFVAYFYFVTTGLFPAQKLITNPIGSSIIESPDTIKVRSGSGILKEAIDEVYK